MTIENLTMSTCAPASERGSHVFQITQYSMYRGIGVGRCLRSANFTVGGHVWCILFYPDGLNEDCKDYVSVGIWHVTSGTEAVRASVRFGLHNPTTTPRSSPMPPVQVMVLTFPIYSHGHIARFIKRSEMEATAAAAGYLVGDTLRLYCVLNVVKGPTVVSEARPFGVVCYTPPPPSDITEHLGKLLEAKEATDVTFKVGEEEFPAHRIVLAMRSPVLKAQLYGPMQPDMTPIPIPDMQPAVFRALLHFIYTDSLPSMADMDRDDRKEMAMNLLVAADRYAMERLKLVCERSLRKGLDVKSVATTLALADQHNCIGLKEACIQFIACSGKEDEFIASQGYAQLKRTSASVVTEMWEKASKIRRTLL